MGRRRNLSPQVAGWIRKQGFAAQMRDNPTPAEAYLWSRLVTGDHGGWKQQVVAQGWILDFYCRKARLAVEVDGGYHLTREAEDRLRDEVLLKSRGIRTLRLSNSLVLDHIDAALARIDVERIKPREQPAKPKQSKRERPARVNWTADPTFTARVKDLAGQLTPIRDRKKLVRTLDATCQKFFGKSLAEWLRTDLPTAREQTQSAVLAELVRRFAVSPYEAAKHCGTYHGEPRWEHRSKTEFPAR